MTKFQENLKKYREEAGMREKELAALAGIDYGVYIAIEYGGHEPLMATVVKIANALKISMDVLVGRIGDNERRCSKQEALGRIIEICKRQEEECSCPFYNADHDECVFWSAGLSVPCDWKEW